MVSERVPCASCRLATGLQKAPLHKRGLQKALLKNVSGALRDFSGIPGTCHFVPSLAYFLGHVQENLTPISFSHSR